MAIYLDNHATTPVDPRVLDAMLPFFKHKFGNAASRSHHFGREAELAVDRARAQVAAFIGAEPREIVFTSGATESNNLALKGAAAARKTDGRRILASPIEHPSVVDTLAVLAAEGFSVEMLPVDAGGRVTDFESALTDDTILVTVMAANNEIGTVQPFAGIAAAARERGAWFHTDATQGVGKVSFDVRRDGIDLAALTGHKIYGPKGCGALFVRQGIELVAQQHGGAQERGLRSGTLNVPGIVGLGMACEIAAAEHDEEAERTRRLRDRLKGRLFAELDGVTLNGDPEHRLPGNLHVSIRGIDSQTLMMAVEEVAVSAGAACASGTIEPSHTMKAIGATPERAGSSIRFGIGRFNTAEEIERAADLFVEAVKRLRAKS